MSGAPGFPGPPGLPAVGERGEPGKPGRLYFLGKRFHFLFLSICIVVFGNFPVF